MKRIIHTLKIVHESEGNLIALNRCSGEDGPGWRCDHGWRGDDWLDSPGQQEGALTTNVAAGRALGSEKRRREFQTQNTKLKAENEKRN